MRSPDELLASAIAVIDAAFAADIPIYSGRAKAPKIHHAGTMAALFSGGHDSTCAVHVASQHPRWNNTAHHIDTGIGSRRTREHVEKTAAALGWELKVYKSPATYERFVERIGFPGPGGHAWVYAWLKDRCVAMLTTGRKRVALVTGARSQESTRRMGHVEPVKVGEWQESADGTRKHVRKNRVWVAPCHDWSAEEQLAYMEWFDLPKNPVKLMLGMSGECFCGAFASPGELDRIRHHCPDVAAKIDRLAEIAKANGRPCVWGTRPDKSKGKVTLPRTGELCSTCDLRAAAAGIDFSETRGTCG